MTSTEMRDLTRYLDALRLDDLNALGDNLLTALESGPDGSLSYSSISDWDKDSMATVITRLADLDSRIAPKLRQLSSQDVFLLAENFYSELKQNSGTLKATLPFGGVPDQFSGEKAAKCFWCAARCTGDDS